MNTQVLMATIITLLTHMGLLMCHPASWRSGYTPPVYLPGPQFCPDTGRTVCAAVDYYPTERIYNLLTSTRSQVFNITSLFVDERKGDAEPNLSHTVVHPPYYQNGDSYYSMHPTPGGRFSPAGSDGGGEGGGGGLNRSRWGSQTGNGRYDAPWTTDQNRWRQVPASNQDHSGPRRGIANGQHQVGNGYNAKRRDLQNNGQSWANVDGLHTGRRLIKPSVKSNNRNNPRAEVGPAFLQQESLPDDTDDSNPFWMNQQPKSYDGRSSFPTQNADGRQNPKTYHQQYPSDVNNRGQEAYGSYGQPQNPLGNPQQWDGPQGQLIGRAENLPTEEPKFQNAVKRGRRNMDVEGACAVRSTFVPPRAALNDQSEWKYIINVPERDQRFSQVVRVDLCLREGQPCSSKLSLPFGFSSRCRQKYIKKKLLSLNPDGQGTAEDNFFIPSCCVCEIVRSNNSNK